MTATESPVEFLTRVLAEVEQIAKAATHGGSGIWPYQCNHTDWEGADLPASHDLCARIDNDELTIYDEGGHSPEQARHICAWDPATALRQIACARKLLAVHWPKPDGSGFPDTPVCPVCVSANKSTWPDMWVEDYSPCETLTIEAERWGWTG